MSNMSYCRFRNTLSDLADCQENMEDDPANMCERERDARLKLIRMCAEIAEEWGEEIGLTVGVEGL